MTLDDARPVERGARLGCTETHVPAQNLSWHSAAI
jgi:hypothetical protein